MLSSALPLILDTGSAGMTLYAPDIFPSSMVSSNGFVFQAGSTTLQFNGITVTNVQAIKSFAQTTQVGNIGFANVTFGANGELTTASMPIFFYFRILNNGTGLPLSTLPPQRGIFGISSAANTITVANSVTPTSLSVCSLQSSTTCHLVSPLRYLSYGSGINAGFMLRPATLQSSCDMTTWNGCTQADIFTVGVTSTSEIGFASESLACPGNQPSGSSSGISVCQPAISSTVSVTGTNYSFSTPVLFDTGNPIDVLNIPTASSSNFPSTVAAGTGISITTPSGFTYTYTAGPTGTSSATNVNQNTNPPSIIGIDFFTSHSFFVDFTSNTVGFR
jgi:hypothetical protein